MEPIRPSHDHDSAWVAGRRRGIGSGVGALPPSLGGATHAAEASFTPRFLVLPPWCNSINDHPVSGSNGTSRAGGESIGRVRRSNLLAPGGMFAQPREAFASSEPVTVCDAVPADAHAPALPYANITPDSARERSAGIHPELSNVRFARDGVALGHAPAVRDVPRAPVPNRWVATGRLLRHRRPPTQHRAVRIMV